MKITSKQYARALYEAAQGKTRGEVKNVIEKYVGVIVNNNNTVMTNEIIRRFIEIWNREKGVVEAEVVSAGELSGKTVKLLNSHIVRLSGAKKVELSRKRDKNILGGVVIKYGDKIFDASLMGRLKELEMMMRK